MPTVEELLDEAEEAIKSSDHVDLWRVSDARINAEELLSHTIGREVQGEDFEDEVSRPLVRRFRRLVSRRCDGEPVAMIVGHIEFSGMELIVKRGTFIPRNSSEFLAQRAIQAIRGRRSPIAIDVATGTGPVALAVANRVKKADVYGLDIADAALRLARENAKNLKLPNITFIRSDMLARLPKHLMGNVDAFTIHPPYVGRPYLSSLSREVSGFEPRVALTDGSLDGLELVRRLAGEAPDWLVEGGWLLVEVSPDLARSVRSLLIRSGFKGVRSQKDSLGATRIISGRL
jgi:release factor glutamine methyltransferase